MKEFLIILSLIFFSLVGLYAQEASDSLTKPSDDELLAAQYFQNKEYEKASALYSKLYNKNQNPFYYNKYLNCLIELKNYQDAEKVIKKRIKKGGDLKYRVDLGYIYMLKERTAIDNEQNIKKEDQTGKNEKRKNRSDEGKNKSEKEFESILKDIKGDYREAIDVANAFLLRNLTEYAVKTYIKSRNILNFNNLFNAELATIYEKTGDFQAMIDEYLFMLNDNRAMLEQVENRLQLCINNDPENKKNIILKKTLIKRIQQQPNNTIFAELLIWQAIQNRDFESALQQAKSIDRLYKEQGERIYNIAKLCTSNNDYSLAEDAYEYILRKGRDNQYYKRSSIELLNVKLRRIEEFKTDKMENKLLEIKNLEGNFITAINEFGKTSETVNLIKNLAHIQAFYLDKYNEATDLLNEAIKLQQLSREDRAVCKTELADVQLMSGNVWEATLQYSQVEKDFKHDTIGYSAKFKNAKLFYYIGEFKWAKAQLDVLKAATSKLIANDAMDLYLLINDNTDFNDSTGVADLPLKMYARADLKTFQNKDELALQTLDSIFKLYSGQTICDRTLYKKAEIKIKQGKFEDADTLLATIVTKFPYSVMVDDALFRRAEIYQYQFKNKEKAMELYETLIKNYTSSVYVVDARKRFRQLRGDQLN